MEKDILGVAFSYVKDKQCFLEHPAYIIKANEKKQRKLGEYLAKDALRFYCSNRLFVNGGRVMPAE